MPKMASIMFPVFEQDLRRLQCFASRWSSGKIFNKVVLAAPRIPCDSGSHKGNAQRYTLVDNLATSLHFIVLRIGWPTPPAL